MSVRKEQTQETKTGGDKKPRKKGMKWLIGAAVVLLLFLFVSMGSSDKSEKEQTDNAFQEAFSQAYLLPDELGRDKTVTELLDVLCGDESVFYLKRNDGMIDVTYQAKTMWLDNEADVKLSLELDPENYVVTPINMTLDETEMEPRFMDAFLLRCAGYDTLSEEVLDQWANGQSESYFDEVRAGEEEARKEAERIEEEFLAELEDITSSENTETTESEEDSLKAISECTALEFYTILQENGVADYVLNDKATEFLSNHDDFFPLVGETDSWEAIDWELTVPQVLKSPGRYGDTMMDILLQVVQINEIESQNEEYFTTIVGVDYDGNPLYLIYKGELPEVFADDYLDVIGLPLGVVTYESLGGGKVNAVLIAVSEAFLNNGATG